ncbi:hypothetical protein CYMTET_7699 [Cymbomonas tetramitiformis]|uniref:Uncharacterized protein n=1 Tax=Cymbomonas tetramitiformis TaxID=36881 RepID=A0AAE0GV03_9CHLO|nr:hypothetical protein CYMTET_7699 [Cymbomonas tetramitiformis]
MDFEDSRRLIGEAEALTAQPGRSRDALKRVEAALVGEFVQSRVLDDKENTAAAMYALSNCMAGEIMLYQIGRHFSKAALENFKNARDVDGSVRASAGYAAALGSSGRTEEAKELLGALEGQPGSPLPVTDLMYVGKAYMFLGDEVKGEQLLKSAWARGGDPYELAIAQVHKYVRGRTDGKAAEDVEGYKQAIDSLKNAARLNRKDVRARYRIGLMCEERFHHQLLYGGAKRSAEEGGDEEEGPKQSFMPHGATWSASAMEDEILAIGQMHGCWGNPTVEELLQGLLAEHKSCLEAGKQSDADTVMVLYQFKCRQLVSSGSGLNKAIKPDQNMAAAAKEYEEALQSNPVTEVLLHLVRAKLVMGSRDKAAELARKATAADPEHSEAKMYAAFLAQPSDPSATSTCPQPILDAATAIEECVESAVVLGPGVTSMCLGENLSHAVNPDLSSAAVLLSMGYNAASRHLDAENLCAKLLHLVPAAMKEIAWASVLQMELQQLCTFARYQLLHALVSRAADQCLGAQAQILAPARPPTPFTPLTAWPLRPCPIFCSYAPRLCVPVPPSAAMPRACAAVPIAHLSCQPRFCAAQISAHDWPLAPAGAFHLVSRIAPPASPTSPP